MNKDLEKVCEEKADYYVDVELCGMAINEEHVHNIFKDGFQAAIESEHVQKLVEALEKIKNIAQEQIDLNYPGMPASPVKSICGKALQAFKGDEDE